MWYQQLKQEQELRDNKSDKSDIPKLISSDSLLDPHSGLISPTHFPPSSSSSSSLINTNIPAHSEKGKGDINEDDFLEAIRTTPTLPPATISSPSIHSPIDDSNQSQTTTTTTTTTTSTNNTDNNGELFDFSIE